MWRKPAPDFRFFRSTKMPALKGGYDSWRNYEHRRRPIDDATKRREELFASLCSFIQTNNGWVVSVPLAKTLRFECLPNSRLPERLAELGFEVRHAGTTSRIVPNAISESYADDRRERRTRIHHGVIQTWLYEFPMTKR